MPFVISRHGNYIYKLCREPVQVVNEEYELEILNNSDVKPTKPCKIAWKERQSHVWVLYD